MSQHHQQAALLQSFGSFWFAHLTSKFIANRGFRVVSRHTRDKAMEDKYYSQWTVLSAQINEWRGVKDYKKK